MTATKAKSSPERKKESLEVQRLQFRLADPPEPKDGEESGEQLARFHILGSTRTPIENYFGEPMHVDLDSMEIPDGPLPVLLEHMRDQRVGFADQIELTDEGLEFDGAFLGNELAQQVRQDALDGFPFGASISFVSTRHWIAEDETALANGEEVEGPAWVLKNGELKEVSFAAIGADPNAEATALSVRGGDPAERRETDKDGKMTKTTEVQLTLDELREKHPDVYKAAFSAGVEEERGRVSKILGRAKPHTFKLAADSVAAGDSYEETLEKMLDAPAAPESKPDGDRKTERLAAITEHTEGAVGPGNDDDAPPSTPEERFKAEFAASQELQTEFGDVEVYLAFKRHKGGEVTR